MKNLYFLLLLAFFVHKANAQWVTIPDPNFVTFLHQNYPACMNGNQMDTTCSGIVNATTVGCNNKNISDLTGIQYFDNLISLHCYDNNLTFLPNLPNTLEILRCDDNQLTSLSNLPSTLKDLRCGWNQLTSISNLPFSLTKLDCRHNQITSLPNLPQTLQELTCSNNQITSLPTLPPTLQTLGCGYNQLSSLTNLPATLQILGCGYNQFTSLPNLPNNLTELYCQGLQLTNLPTLPLTLKYLDCSANQLNSLPTLPESLLYLYCYLNLLNSIPNLPDSMNILYLNENPNLHCLPQLKKILNLSFTNTGIQCLPNYGDVTNSNPVLSSLPLCNSSINPQIISSSTSLCGVSSITLSTDTSTGYSYQWQLNGNNISGAASQTYVATVAGDYTVVVTYNCALDTSNTITITSGAAPSAAISATGLVSFCSGGSVTLNANTGTGLTYQWQLNGTNINGATSPLYIATATGNYSVMVSNNCGNSISNIISVTVTYAPGSAGTISGPSAFCRFSTQSFSVAPVAGATNYVWSLPPQTTMVSGAGTNSITVSFKVKQGDVTVKAANQCGAGPLSILPVQVIKCFQTNNAVIRSSSISESELELYPNPARSEVIIQFYSETENNYAIKLCDIHGRMVMEQNSIAVEGINEFTLDVEFLSKGVYMIELTTADERMMKKLVLQ